MLPPRTRRDPAQQENVEQSRNHGRRKQPSDCTRDSRRRKEPKKLNGQKESGKEIQGVRNTLCRPAFKPSVSALGPKHQLTAGKSTPDVFQLAMTEL